jgi:hypothetical protein
LFVILLFANMVFVNLLYGRIMSTPAMDNER